MAKSSKRAECHQHGERLRAAIAALCNRVGSAEKLHHLLLNRFYVDVGPRRIERLMNHGSAKLSLSEFEALEGAASRYGLGALLLQSRGLIQELALARAIRVLVGTHFARGDEQSFCTLFDLKASVAIAQGLERTAGPAITWKFDHVPPRNATEQRGIETWREDEAVVSLGSSLSNSRTELLLAEALGVEAFPQSPARPLQDRGARRGRFFCLVMDDRSSGFAITPEQLRRTGSSTTRKALGSQDGIAPRDRPRRGLLLASGAEEVFYPEFERRGVGQARWTYGVLVAHRRFGHPPRVVCAGLNGPGTYLLAQMLAEAVIGKQLAVLREKQWEVYGAVVRGRVSEDPNAPGDNRRVSGGEVLDEWMRAS